MKGRRLMSLLAALVLALPAGAGAQSLDCLIYPETTVAVSSPVEGVLDRVVVDRGDLVKEGQVVATIESSVERAALRLARARAEKQSGVSAGLARVEFGDRRYKRTLQMYRRELIPLKEMDEAETSKVLAEYELVERLLNGGEFTKQAPIVRLAQIDPLRVEVIVPVALFGRIKIGMPANVTPEAPVGGTWPARVTVVDRVIDAASGTFGVRLALPNPAYKLPAGLKCRVQFNGAAR